MHCLPDLCPSRRELLGLIGAASAAPALARSPSRIEAIAFDAFVLFDPRSLVARAGTFAGDRAQAFIAAASTKLFAYTWLYTSAGQYRPIDVVAADAFRFAAASERLELGTEQIAHLVQGYSELRAWPDVAPALEVLTGRGLRLAMLSNLSEAALRANLGANGIDSHFQFVLSTDQARKFKPAPAAYELAVRAFHRSPRQIGFAASASWDAAGATWFGYPTAWINRLQAPAERLDIGPAIVTDGMQGVLKLAAVG